MSSGENAAQAVARAMLAIGAVSFVPDAPMTFKSGIVSPVYCDGRKLPFAPEAWHTVIAGFEELIAEQGIAFDVLGGIETAGIPHSAALSYAMNVPSIFIRKAAKEHGLKRRVEGGDVTGKRVLLVEDVVTTGGSSLSGVEALRSEGGVVTDCLAILRYDFANATEKFAETGVRLHTLTTFEALLAVAAETKVLDTAGVATLEAWLADPRGWAASRGTA
jgi:orotate phosphoribosyltransferase